MSIIHDIFPAFYLNIEHENLTESELALIVPKLPQEVVLLFEDVLSKNEEPPQANEQISRHGYTKPVNIVHIDTSVLTKTVLPKKIELNGLSSRKAANFFDDIVNHVDFFGISENEHRAAPDIFRQHEQNDAQVTHAKIVHKVLPPMLLKHHYQIAAHLLKEGYVDTHQELKHHSKEIYSMIFSDLTEVIHAYVKNPNNATLLKISNLLETIELFAQHGAKTCYVPDLTQSSYNTTYTPLGMMLRVYASLSPDDKLMNKLLTTADYLSTVDTSETQYLHAKNLLLAFPTGASYPLALSDYEHVDINSENGYALFTTKLAHASLSQYLCKLKTENANSHESEIFEDLASIFWQATNACEKRVIPETSEEVAEHYSQGETVLLATGWQGHSFDVALNKTQELYLTANSGQQLELTENHSGDTFRHLNQSGMIDSAFFYELLTNTEQGFEKNLVNKYAVSEPTDFIDKPEQRFGNCTWESHRDAVEGLIYMKLLSQNHLPQEAKALANTYFNNWDRFHGDYVIDTYFKNHPSLPAAAMLDIINELKAENNPLHAKHIEKLTNMLTGESYFDYSLDGSFEFSPQTEISAEASSSTPNVAYHSPFISPLEPVIASPEPALVC
ncbi:MAG: hypothetical protein JSR17_13350 [Proteobacteria bacterium]|nr:hypothetical protein [Pseudomonadota bacterium]